MVTSARLLVAAGVLGVHGRAREGVVRRDPRRRARPRRRLCRVRASAATRSGGLPIAGCRSSTCRRPSPGDVRSPCGASCSASISSTPSPHTISRSTTRCATSSSTAAVCASTMLNDHLWLAPLDPERVLGARTYAVPGRVVIEVHAPDGRRIDASRSSPPSGGDAAATPTADAPDLVCDSRGARHVRARREPLERARRGRACRRAPGPEALVSPTRCSSPRPRPRCCRSSSSFSDQPEPAPATMPNGPARPAEAVHHQLIDLGRGSRCLRRRRVVPRAPSRSTRGSRRNPTASGCPSPRSGACRTGSPRR